MATTDEQQRVRSLRRQQRLMLLAGAAWRGLNPLPSGGTAGGILQEDGGSYILTEDGGHILKEP